MTMSQILDVNRELAEVGAMFEVFHVLRHGLRLGVSDGISPNS